MQERLIACSILKVPPPTNINQICFKVTIETLSCSLFLGKLWKGVFYDDGVYSERFFISVTGNSVVEQLKVLKNLIFPIKE